MQKLIDIESFGGIDADTDFLLEQCFRDHEAYLNALSQKKFLIVGRKGSGKTAIFRKLLRLKEPNVFSFGHTFRDYPWHHHDKQKKSGVPDEECFSHSWKYLILITTAKILLNYDQSVPHDEFSATAMSGIESFVIDTYGSRDPDITTVFQPAMRLKLSASLGFSALGLEGKAAPSLVPITDLPAIAHEVNQNLQQKIIGSLNPESKYYILFDELDIGFKKDALYAQRLIGLILAARSINLYARDTGRHLNVIVFLRDDIYEFLKFEDKNKITESGAVRIEWDTRRTARTLREIMDKRFSELLGYPEGLAWDRVFNETKEMRGHQTKYDHIIDRTMLRPRDMIKFCNATLNEYKRDTQGSPSFENPHVNSARQEYSQYFLSEIKDEIFQHIPNHLEYFEFLRELQAVQFELSEFQSICDARKSMLPDGVSAATILAELFEFSVIGYYQPGGAGYGGAEFVFRYRSPEAMFNINSTKFQVHLGLQEVLALKRYRRNMGDGPKSDQEE